MRTSELALRISSRNFVEALAARTPGIYHGGQPEDAEPDPLDALPDGRTPDMAGIDMFAGSTFALLQGRVHRATVGHFPNGPPGTRPGRGGA